MSKITNVEAKKKRRTGKTNLTQKTTQQKSDDNILPEKYITLHIFHIKGTGRLRKNVERKEEFDKDKKRNIRMLEHKRA